MLGKLFKYDFKWINKIMYVYFIIMFILTIAVKIVESLDQTLFLVIVDKIVSGMFIAGAISTIITCIMRIWARYMNNIYKDESYLTHTLPVTKNQIFNAKILASICSLILSILAVIICIAIIYLNKDTIDHLKIMYQSLVDVYSGGFAVLFIGGVIAIVLLEVIYFMMTGIFGITIGYKLNNNKTIMSIVFGIGTYGVLSTISAIILGIMSKFADFEIVEEGFPSINTIKVMGITGIIIYLVFNIGYYLVTKKLLNKGVNVD